MLPLSPHLFPPSPPLFRASSAMKPRRYPAEFPRGKCALHLCDQSIVCHLSFFLSFVLFCPINIVFDQSCVLFCPIDSVVDQSFVLYCTFNGFVEQSSVHFCPIKNMYINPCYQGTLHSEHCTMYSFLKHKSLSHEFCGE